MRVLITGIAGFIGSHLAERFLKDGWEVAGIDNLSTGSEDNLPDGGVYFFGDIQDVKNGRIENWHLNTDVILNFASPASPVAYYNDPIGTLITGSRGVENMLQLAHKRNAKILMASTSEVYGDPPPEHHPQKESYYGNVNSVGLRSCYDEAKRFAEACFMAYHRVLGVDTRICRIFNTYGPKMNPLDGRVIPNFINQALENKDITIYGSGAQTRSFCYIDDLVDGIIAVLDGDHMPYNIGNPHEVTMIELAEVIIQLTGSASSITYHDIYQDDPARRKPVIDRVNGLGWKPSTGLIEGLTKTIEYFS